MISWQTTKCHTTRHQTVFFKGWEFFVLTSMRWYVERVSLEKKKAGVAAAAASVGATAAAFLQARESSSLLTLRGCSDREAARPNQPGQAHSLNSLGTMQLKEKEMANYVEGSMQYSRSPTQQAQRKAKPATNPDVHQTRQDCNCVLAIRMQRYTMYYYVVVMLLCCKWPLLAILQRLRVHWERKKMQQANYKRQHLAFLFYDQIYFRGAKDVFFFFLPSLFQKASSTVHFMAHSRARSRFKVFFCRLDFAHT